MRDYLQEHLRDLLRAAAEVRKLEADRARQERAARKDAFRAVIQTAVAAGRINALSQWPAFKEEFETVPEALALQQDAILPQNVFFDVVDELMTKFKGDKKVCLCILPPVSAGFLYM